MIMIVVRGSVATPAGVFTEGQQVELPPVEAGRLLALGTVAVAPAVPPVVQVAPSVVEPPPPVEPVEPPLPPQPSPSPQPPEPPKVEE